ncbi:hypothetical protein M2475_001455 [Breznakia sp. PF5-3]|nr:hypothetical protein [Breznakia sp. PM6-1]MDF9835881.1 hypothetical protein [Breznakia sp. PF5-3]MDF9837626.1 hypothetical protein [Breznakia sp. PFB2-8]
MLFFHFLKYFVVKSSFKKGTFSNKELSLQIDQDKERLKEVSIFS